jgi:hypothetical protein
MGLDLNNPTTQTNTKKPWDASAYTGVAFWAKTNTKTSISILVAFPSTQTDPTGGNCDPSPGAEKIEKCDDHFAASVLLGTDWSYFKLPFSKTAQTGWGKPYAALDVTSLLGLQWRLGANTDFDFVVDDIQFYVE